MGSDDLAARFRRFAETECAGISPLYAALGRGIAEDPGLLALAARARPGQPAPNMLFAAVHFLLLQEHGTEPLAGFYASLTNQPAPPEGAFPAFQAFCQAYEGDIAALLTRRAVGTNEVRRSACLMPAYALAAKAGGAPLHIVEVGASAGLNLLWDHYAYDYGPAGRVGPAAAALTLHCAARGRPPPLPDELPRVSGRLGIDPAPLDPVDPGDGAWLRALIWPEQRDRAERLAAALALAAQERPRVIRGNALDRLAEVVDSLPAEGTPCVSHAFTLNQFPPRARADFHTLLQALGRNRPLYEVGLEWGAGPAPELILARHDRQGAARRLLARCDAHGAWIEWLEK